MKIVVNTTGDNYIRIYLTIWKSTFKLTDAECIVLEAILKRYMNFKQEGVKEEYIPDLLFNSHARKEIQESLGYSQQHFNNIIKILKDKRIITPVKDIYMITEKRLIPQEELIFNFVRK